MGTASENATELIVNMKTLIFATGNENKLKEIRSILVDLEIKGLKDLGFYDEIPETGLTLEENALIKAKYLYDHSGMMSFSEDTGLEVEALNGAPGVHTARYAGEDKDPKHNIKKLLAELSGIHNRKARFRTVIALYDGQNPIYFEGIVAGEIALIESGSGGFGYDPIFIPEGYQSTFAVLDDEVKNSISHRARAVAKLKHYIQTQDF